jgi:CheY-like chemotaxis protein/phosphoribosyl 1,2-cyclic phosphodiesterase
MRIRFWGTRGSLAKPGPSTLRYGGNTSCVEARTAGGTLVVLDCGTGAHALGLALTARDEGHRGHLLITHTHWDHIQGFPFFAPLFEPGNEWDIYAPGGLGRRLEETLSGQMEYTYFPVTLEQLGATIRYHDLAEGAFPIDGVRVVTRFLNHPALTLGYRLESGGAVVVYAVDHEPHGRDPGEVAGFAGAAALPVHQEDRRHIEFLAGADLVVHDAQYTLEEYPARVGWGHSPAEYVVDMALAAKARRLALTHHAPLRDDEALDRIVEVCRRRAAAAGGALEVFGAAEGQALELPEHVGHGARERGGPASAAAPPEAARRTVLVVDDNPEIVAVLVDALETEGFRMLTAPDGETALRVARSERPDLILLDWILPGCDGLTVCRALRADTDPRVRGVPVVLLTANTGTDHVSAGFAAGATDYLTKPFRVAHIRSRVRGWLLRAIADPA